MGLRCSCALYSTCGPRPRNSSGDNKSFSIFKLHGSRLPVHGVRNCSYVPLAHTNGPMAFQLRLHQLVTSLTQRTGTLISFTKCVLTIRCYEEIDPNSLSKILENHTLTSMKYIKFKSEFPVSGTGPESYYDFGRV